jgi:hypothetical protein
MGEIASESIFMLTDTFNMCHPSYESMSISTIPSRLCAASRGQDHPRQRHQVERITNHRDCLPAKEQGKIAYVQGTESLGFFCSSTTGRSSTRVPVLSCISFI